MKTIAEKGLIIYAPYLRQSRWECAASTRQTEDNRPVVLHCTPFLQQSYACAFYCCMWYARIIYIYTAPFSIEIIVMLCCHHQYVVNTHHVDEISDGIRYVIRITIVCIFFYVYTFLFEMMEIFSAYCHTSN